MFLLNVLLDLTDELNEFCRSFAIQNTLASLYSILAYQINFLHLDFQFPRRLFPPPPIILTIFKHKNECYKQLERKK